MPQLSNLIKPEMIPRLPYFPEDMKPKYIEGVTRLWNTINTLTPNYEHPEYQAAYKKLVEVTVSIKKTVEESRLKATQAASAASAGMTSANGALDPTNPSAQANATGQRPQSQAKPGASAQEVPQVPQKYLEKVESMKILVNPALVAEHSPEQVQNYIRTQKLKYAQIMHRYDASKGRVEQLQSIYENRATTNRPLTDQEEENFQGQMQKATITRDQALGLIQHFQKEQKQIAEQMRIKNQAGLPNTQVPKQDQASSAVQSQMAEGQVGGPATGAQNVVKGESGVSGRLQAVNAGGQEQSQKPGQAPTTDQVPAANNDATANANLRAQQQQGQSQAPQPPQHSEANKNVKIEPPAQNPQGALPVHHMPPGEPQPLKHEDALNRARLPQAGYPQNMPQQPTHAHPTQHTQREGQANSHSKLPVPKELSIPPPQPVAMGPSRPTMTGGPMPGGPVGQPAIQRQPGYVLEGDGERVLSKKKLQDLVRQVTGGSGAEDEDGEKISAELEEVSSRIPNNTSSPSAPNALRPPRLCSTSPTNSSTKSSSMPASSPNSAPPPSLRCATSSSSSNATTTSASPASHPMSSAPSARCSPLPVGLRSSAPSRLPRSPVESLICRKNAWTRPPGLICGWGFCIA